MIVSSLLRAKEVDVQFQYSWVAANLATLTWSFLEGFENNCQKVLTFMLYVKSIMALLQTFIVDVRLMLRPLSTSIIIQDKGLLRQIF
jgi:type IV secretory pathway TraG/TraD family ATPase VirD4